MFTSSCPLMNRSCWEKKVSAGRSVLTAIRIAIARATRFLKKPGRISLAVIRSLLIVVGSLTMKPRPDLSAFARSKALWLRQPLHRCSGKERLDDLAAGQPEGG